MAPHCGGKEICRNRRSFGEDQKNTKTPFGIDFGVGDVIVPKQERERYRTQLDDFTNALTVNTYSLETTVAEKLDAMLSLMEFSSRMKGLLRPLLPRQ